MSKSMNSHHSSVMISDTWLTPKYIIDALGEFDLDPCTPEFMPWETAKTRFTKADDGLIQQWLGRVWLNPPYSREAGIWMKKLAEHNRGTALLLARTETKDWFQNVWPKAEAILFMDRRIHFHLPDGSKAKANCGAAPALIAYGEEDGIKLAESGIGGKYIPLNYTPIIVVGASPSWFSVVSMSVRQQGSDEDLAPIYDLVERMAPEKVIANRHWREKVRQQIQVYRKKQNLN